MTWWYKWKWNFNCHFKFSDGRVLTVKALEVIESNEVHSGKKPAYFISCPFVAYDSHTEIKFPDLVGISDKNYEFNFVGITYPRNALNDSKEIAVCPGPIQGNYQNALRIAEYVEMNRILGASKFYFYNLSMSKDVEDLIRYYESQEIAEIISWNIGDVLEINENVIHYYGIMATLNDCFYRATIANNYKYVIFTDFDEIIFPYKSESLSEFLEFYDTPQYHSFTFSNNFFFAEFSHDLLNAPKNAVNRFLYTQALIQRTQLDTDDSKFYHVRTKFIAKRDFVIEVGNHFVWKAFKETNEFIVKSDVGNMYHYREPTLSEFKNTPTIKDIFARKFADKLWKNVDNVCKNVYESGNCTMGEIIS